MAVVSQPWSDRSAPGNTRRANSPTLRLTVTPWPKGGRLVARIRIITIQSVLSALKCGTRLVESVRVNIDLTRKDCPSRQILDRIGDTWSVLIVTLLRDGPLRFTELHRRIEGVTPKMLTQTLRGLERDGLVTRTVFPVVPPRVDYELTGLGRSLENVVDTITAWADTHIDDVLTARGRYDTR
ncbi:helix-turn-helix transcriptional regulator [Herbidospora galbida]|uniref:Helix-turn-helix transcriptional regulator n=1 Tax=Herbidospora galbida TaxID=2575442 RepID=A0A4U3MRX6_9ACTN|nr:helix-turn-helix transcriptional regulator [Herbidospora galbida]